MANPNAFAVPEWQVLGVVAGAVLVLTAGDAYLSIGMKRLGAVSVRSVRDAVAVAVRGAEEWQLWLSLALQAGFFGLYSLALSWAPLSFVMPFTALAYLLVVIISRFYLREHVSLERWVGVGLVTLGLYLVGRSAPS